MTGEPVVYEVSGPERERRRVRARTWWQALEVALGGELPPATGWTLTVEGDAVIVRAGGEDLVRVEPLAAEAGAVGVVDDGTAIGGTCRATLEEAQRRVPSDAGAVLLLERGYLRFVAASGPRAASLVGVRISATTGVAGDALTAMRPLRVDAGSDPRHFDGLDDLTGYRTGALIAVPIARRGAVYGVLELMNPPPERPFHPSDLLVVERVVQRLAGALGG